MVISVIIPTYKPQKYIEECLESLKNQTFDKQKFEIIIVLNGCNEPYKSQLQDYINANLGGYNVTFIHTDKAGVSNARNMGIDVAQGDYITFIDDDDFVSKKYLEELFDKSSDDTIAICYPYAFYDGDTTQRPYTMTKEYDMNVCNGKQCYLNARKFFSGPCMKLFPKHYIGAHRFDVNFSNGEDSLFMFAISENFQNIQFTTKEAIYYRRIREGSATTTYRFSCKIVLNSMRLIWAYSKLYFRKPLSYNMSFYITRILGAIRKIFYR